jgi:hypothetical protein
LSDRRVLTIVGAVSLAVAALFVVRTFAGDTALYRDALTDPTLVRAAAVCKLVLLALACVNATRTFRRLGQGNDARSPWLLLALALGGFTLGQSILSGYQLAVAKSPFPSIADAFFLASYPFLLASFVRFGRTYRRSGLPVGPVRQHLAIAATVLLAGALVAGPLLRRSTSPTRRSTSRSSSRSPSWCASPGRSAGAPSSAPGPSCSPVPSACARATCSSRGSR